MIYDLIDFFSTIFQQISNLWLWLNRPLFTRDTASTAMHVAERIGFNIDWIWSLTPLEMLSAGVVIVLSSFLIIKLVGAILDAIPILGG